MLSHFKISENVFGFNDTGLESQAKYIGLTGRKSIVNARQYRL